MPRKKVITDQIDSIPSGTAVSAEARENQMIAMAVNLAEKQLREGTASSQVITHYLKLGSSRDRLERDKLRMEKELMEAKIEVLKKSETLEEKYIAAIDAMKRYNGQGEDDDSDLQ